MIYASLLNKLSYMCVLKMKFLGWSFISPLKFHIHFENYKESE